MKCVQICWRQSEKNIMHSLIQHKMYFYLWKKISISFNVFIIKRLAVVSSKTRHYLLCGLGYDPILVGAYFLRSSYFFFHSVRLLYMLHKLNRFVGVLTTLIPNGVRFSQLFFYASISSFLSMTHKHNFLNILYLPF